MNANVRLAWGPLMFGKLLLIIVASGLTAAALLVTRQQRIDTAHELSVTHQRMLQLQRSLWKLQSQIAWRCRPEEVKRMMDGLPEQWTAIPDPQSLEEQPPRITLPGARETVYAGYPGEEPRLGG